MGSFTSKQWADLMEITSKSKNERLEKESSSTPNLHRILPLDPRSPTSEISRTPIQVEKTPISEFAMFNAKTKYDLKNTGNSSNKLGHTKSLFKQLQNDFQEKDVADNEETNDIIKENKIDTTTESVSKDTADEGVNKENVEKCNLSDSINNNSFENQKKEKDV